MERVMRGWQFRPGLAVTAAAIVFASLTLWLGLWQTQRAEEKEAMQARLNRLAVEPPLDLSPALVDPGAVAFRRVVVRGEYEDRYTILLDNKVHRGRVGYEVVAPLRIAGTDLYVLVNRGWVPAGATRAELPDVPRLPGEQTVEGIAVTSNGRFYELAPESPEGPVWQHLVLERYRAWSKL